ncbi:TPM domain-containing protein [Pendulispora albinea]|uniref:TPM domain-containing protein n=1 Tax=Pendulispora albinea TaxID=2741071 RepID=A0ABZ2LRI5_9BACT
MNSPTRGGLLVRALFVFCTVLFALITGTAPAFAYKPPPLDGHVIDTAGKLTPEDIARLDKKLDTFHRSTGYAIVVFLTGSLEGENIDDYTYQTFASWKIGDKGQDNGVLLLIAPNERKIRIETGKGVGGELPDLRANDIIRNKIAPRLREEQFRQAVDDGTNGIMTALAGDDWQTNPRPRKPKVIRTTSGNPLWLIVPLAVPLLILVIIFGAIARAKRRGFGPGRHDDDDRWGGGGGWGGGGFYGGGGGFFGGGGGGGGGGDWGGGSGYSGGGGESGGGGSSDSY